MGEFFMEISGVADIRDCAKGSASACMWTAAGFIPVGKLFKAGKGIGNLLDAAGTFCSFSSDTKVLMADGSTMPIGEIEVGDVVWAADPGTGEQGPRVVTMTFVHEDQISVFRVNGDESIKTTEDHPYWNATDKAWQRADAFDSGDSLLSSSGELIPVLGIIQGSTQVAAAYNLSVADLHAFFVVAGANAILVHNSSGCEAWPNKISGTLTREL
jgi:hypothetical protein